MPLPLLRAIMRRDEADKFHADGRLTATRMLGCPREVVIIDTFPITYDPVRSHSAYIGTRLHKEMEENALPGEYKEIRIPLEGMEPPIVCGRRMSGMLDHVAPDLTEIWDYKFHGDKSYNWQVKKGGADGDLRAQLSLYKYALERTTGVEVKKLGCWHGAMTAATDGTGPWFDVEVEPMTEEEILDYRPKDSDRHPGEQPYTVADILDMYDAHYERVAEGMDPYESARLIPLVGRPMFNKKKCTNYCLARFICDGMEGIPWL